MSRGLCFKNATVVTLEPPAVVPAQGVRCVGGRIDDVGEGIKPESGDEVVDLGGAVLMPGLVVGHHHLYSALARGMPFPVDDPPKDFSETLQKIWWRLDQALDHETVYLSALAGALDAARFGVTTIVDHHASPNAVDGALDRIAQGVGDVGLRALLCYEVSDRDGPEVAAAGIAENLRFQRANRKAPLTRGMIGAHACFTIGNETLDRLAQACQDTGAGLHIHLLEDKVDRRLSEEAHGADPVTRLAERNLLTPNALLAHGVHLNEAELETLRQAKVYFAHNARSNMNNRVGAAPMGRMGDKVILGTDGIDGDILSEARTAMFRGREHDPPLDGARVVSMLHRANLLLQRYFGGHFGVVAPGAVADLVILDYDAPTPLHAANLVGHLGFGWGAHLVRSVVVAGEFVYRDRRHTRLDAAEARQKTRAGADKLWKALG